jgi:hypothetical protein
MREIASDAQRDPIQLIGINRKLIYWLRGAMDLRSFESESQCRGGSICLAGHLT